MGSGTSTAEEEGRLGPTHEEAKLIPLLACAMCHFLFFLKPLSLLRVSGDTCEGLV